MPEQLKRSTPPEELNYIWGWHIELLSAAPLSNLELRAWSELMNIKLLVWEVEALRKLDKVYWRVIHD